eukprot:Gb_28333 [translate_table: standard]
MPSTLDLAISLPKDEYIKVWNAPQTIQSQVSFSHTQVVDSGQKSVFIVTRYAPNDYMQEALLHAKTATKIGPCSTNGGFNTIVSRSNNYWYKNRIFGTTNNPEADSKLFLLNIFAIVAKNALSGREDIAGNYKMTTKC